MNLRPLIFLALSAVAAHAGVEVDMDEFGKSLGGWKKEDGKAAEYKFSESDYRTYKPEITKSPDGGIFISMRVDHVRGMFSADDHASLEMNFAPDGALLSAQAYISIQDRRISSDMFRSAGKSAANAAGQVVNGLAEKAAKLGSEVFASLAGKLLRENVTEPGRVAFPAALRHNYNMLYPCVQVVKDPLKALPVEEAVGAVATAPVKVPQTEPAKKAAPEGMIEVRTFGEAPKEEPKKEAEPAKP
ncbi:hypothetical protein [Prosthecobacter sp.]|uniref:hypothetical protein n=1 Tax=Prosthecobacter sp. TaxID=1965333 RepID=UPI002AB973C1|nr:hypothetical protein [Prosthecobacter sp.]MDZ4402207.1 hypothetical protein [Prosthecobacter sp.]